MAGRREKKGNKARKEVISWKGTAEGSDYEDGIKPGTAFSSKPEHTRIILCLILFFSALLGAVCVIQFQGSPFFELPIIDEEAYVNWGLEIASGEFIGKEVFYQDPLYPYILGAVFFLFEENFLLVRLLQVFMGTASVALVFWTGRKLWGDGPGLLAAGLMAGFRGLYFFEILLLKATTVTLLTAGSCALGVAVADRPQSRARWALLGLSLALLVLLRGNFQAIIPFLLLWAFLFQRKEAARKERLVRAGLMALGLLIVLAPVTLRNYAVGGELVLSTSQGGANFFIGNNGRANGRYVTLPFVRANPKWESKDFEKEAERRTGKEDLSPSEVSLFWFGESWEWIKKAPVRAAELWLHKAHLMIHHYEVPDNHSFYLTREQFVPGLWLPLLGFGLLWGPALVGMYIAGREDRRTWYPALFAVFYAASIIPFFIVSRYRVAVMPSLALFSAAFFFWVLQKWKRTEKKALVSAGVVLVVTMTAGLYPTAESQAPMGAEYYLLGNAFLKTGSPEKALHWYNKGLQELPEHKDMLKNRAVALRRINKEELTQLSQEVSRENYSAEELVAMGKRLEQLGQMPRAVEVYKKAISKNPDYFTAYARLGFLYATVPPIRDTQKAEQYLKKALEIRPASVDTVNALGNVSFLSGDTARARSWWEKALELDPQNKGALQNLKNMKGKGQRP